MRIALLDILFLWPPVTLDCLGQPESGVVYEVSYVWKQCVGWETDTPSCETFALKNIQAETSFSSAIGEPNPPVGAGYWYQIRARDGAGNWSDACL